MSLNAGNARHAPCTEYTRNHNDMLNAEAYPNLIFFSFIRLPFISALVV